MRKQVKKNTKEINTPLTLFLLALIIFIGTVSTADLYAGPMDITPPVILIIAAILIAVWQRMR